MKINILHISDLHLAKTSVRGELLRVNALIETETYQRFASGETAASFNPLAIDVVSDFVNKYKDSLDAILITGDISTTGSNEDLEESLDIITGNGEDRGFGKTTKNRNTVFNFPQGLPVFLLPGNHDRYNNEGLILKQGSDNFDKVFHDFWADNVQTNIVTKENICVGIIAADFSLKNNADSHVSYDLLEHLYRSIGIKHATPAQILAGLAQGRVYDEILTNLINQTNKFISDCEANEKQAFIIWAIHFPPKFPIHNKGYIQYLTEIKNEYKKLIDEDNLLSAAAGLGVDAILAGHWHKPEFYTIGDTNINCSGSTTQFMLDEDEILDNFCHIFTVDVSEGFNIYVSDFQIIKNGYDAVFKRVRDE